LQNANRVLDRADAGKAFFQRLVGLHGSEHSIFEINYAGYLVGGANTKPARGRYRAVLEPAL
jgi:hypothetical protein